MITDRKSLTEATKMAHINAPASTGSWIGKIDARAHVVSEPAWQEIERLRALLITSMTGEPVAHEYMTRGKWVKLTDENDIAKIRRMAAEGQIPAENYRALYTHPSPAPVGEASRFEQYVAAGIANSPAPLRELGKYLASVLDEDKWPIADRLLLQLATHPSPKLPDAVREAMERINRQPIWSQTMLETEEIKKVPLADWQTIRDYLEQGK